MTHARVGVGVASRVCACVCVRAGRQVGACAGMCGEEQLFLFIPVAVQTMLTPSLEF